MLFRSLLCAGKESLVLPAFGGHCGSVSFETIAFLMRKAMEQIGNPPDSLDWEYASRSKIEGCRGNKFMGR